MHYNVYSIGTVHHPLYSTVQEDMENNHFPKQVMINGEWVDSFRTMSDLNSRHSLFFRTTTSLKKRQVSKWKSDMKTSKIYTTKHIASKSAIKKKRHQNIPIPIPIQRSFSDSYFHSGNVQRSSSNDSSTYSGIPLNSPFRTITDMFDVASISRHKNFYFRSN